MRRRALLASSSIGAIALTGCLSNVQNFFDDGTTEPDPDHDVTLRNEHDDVHEFDVEVTRTRNDTVVHEETIELDPRVERTVYNLQRADPDGIEWFEITGSVADQTSTTAIKTDTCFRDAYVTLDADGALGVYHSVC